MTAANAIDFNHLDKYVLGDEGLRDEVLGIFIEQLDRLMESLDPDKDDYAWKTTAHTLKGAARGVGAWDVGDLCQEAETLIGEINNKQRARETLLAALRMKANAAVETARSVACAPA